MERHYETVCIVNPDKGVEIVKDVIEKATALVQKEGGKELKAEDWGKRKFSYPIKKKKEGSYVIFTYAAEYGASKELERMLKYHEDVLRYQTVVVKVDKKKESSLNTGNPTHADPSFRMGTPGCPETGPEGKNEQR